MTRRMPGEHEGGKRLLRFVYGFIAGIIWIVLLSCFNDEKALLNSDTPIITLAIVVAGAMAGGG